MDSPDRYAHDAFRWLRTAKQLDHAAMLIWSAIQRDFERLQANKSREAKLDDYPFSGLGGVFWLNGGFALENLFKGIIIQDDPSMVTNGVISKSLKSHNLLELAALALVDLDPIEGFFLDVGTACATWAGRYPTSLRPGEPSPWVFCEADVAAYRSIFDRLLTRFKPSHFKTSTLVRLGHSE